MAADAKYKDKQIVVTGAVDSIGKDLTNTMYVVIGSGDSDGINGVQCMFDDQYTGQILQLRKGQQATVQGECAGTALRNVLLRDSVLQ